jgi:tetratricopeptide (TPR) repeat protein
MSPATEPNVSRAAAITPHRRLAIMAAGIATVVLVAWAHMPGFRGTFVYDDLQEIVGNSALETLWPPWVPMFAGGRLPHRPLPYFTFALNRVFGGLEPWGYHAVNLAVHVCNGALLWWITQRTLTRAGVAAAGWVAWLGGLLWLVHPLSTQAVTYIYQRMEVMAATFMLATLACFIRSLDTSYPRRWQLAAVLTSVCGCLCKETAVATPLVVLLYDLCCGGADGGPADRRTLWQRMPLHVCLFATWGVTIAVVLVQRARFSEFSQPNFGPVEYALTQPLVILRYLRLAIWPSGQCFDLDWPLATDRLTIGGGIVALVVIATLIITISRPRSAGVFLVFAFLALLAPTSSFIPVNYLYGEHRMYLPSALLAIGMPLGLVTWLGRQGVWTSSRWPLTVVGLGLVTMLAVRTADRNALYASRIRLWEETVAMSPRNPTAHLMLAGAYLDAGRPDAALEAVDRSLTLAPEQAFAHARRAETLFDLGRNGEAAAASHRAIALQPRLPGAYATFLAALLRSGAASDAATAGEQAVDTLADLLEGPNVDPNAEKLFTTLGVAWAMTGDPRAEQAFARAVALNPRSAQAHYNLARAIWQRDPVRGLRLLDDALTLDPQYVAAEQLRQEIVHSGKAVRPAHRPP